MRNETETFHIIPHNSSNYSDSMILVSSFDYPFNLGHLFGGVLFIMRSIDRKFYESTEWRACQSAYMKQANHLCERCLSKGIYSPAKIVHHIIFLNSENFGDPELMFGFDNLFAVCQKCHNEIHGNARNEKRWKFVDGELVTKETEEWKSGETL